MPVRAEDTINRVTLIIPSERLQPADVAPAIFRVARGDRTQIGNNHVISNLDVHTVRLDAGTTNSHVFDSGSEEQFLSHSDSFGFRATP